MTVPDGVIARWAVPHFGQKPAGSALNAVALCLLRHMAARNPGSGELRGASVRTGNGVVWVDDFCLWTVVPWHPPCDGLQGGCTTCLQMLPHSERLDADWQELCADLGVPLSGEKHKTSSQHPAYAGFDFDTVRGVVLTQPEKLEKLLGCLDSWRSAEEISPRGLDGVQGRVMHYSFATRHLRVVATQVFCLLGVVPEEVYDEPVLVSDEMRTLAEEAESIVRSFHAAGRPLWPRVASSLLREFERGQGAGGLSFTLTWDASPHGWAALLRWWSPSCQGGELLERLLIGTWPVGEDVGEQAHREALGAPLALEASCAALDLRGCFGLLANDAEAAIGALRKGSTRSPPMQRQAVRLNRAAYRNDLDLLLFHVPGLALVEAGIDGASRDGTTFGEDANLSHVLGPRVCDQLWNDIAGLIRPLGWVITIDLFASESNARAERFASRYGEPGCETIDALSIPDWAESPCPQCGDRHREVAYAFPPHPLIRHCVQKAIADRGLCVLVVPVAITASYWHKLVRASVLRGRPAVDGFLRVRNAARSVLDSLGQMPAELAVFACDFSRLQPRDGLADLSSRAGAFARRPRHPCRTYADFDVRRRLREALLARPEGWDPPQAPSSH